MSSPQRSLTSKHPRSESKDLIITDITAKQTLVNADEPGNTPTAKRRKLNQAKPWPNNQSSIDSWIRVSAPPGSRAPTTPPSAKVKMNSHASPVLPIRTRSLQMELEERARGDNGFMPITSTRREHEEQSPVERSSEVGSLDEDEERKEVTHEAVVRMAERLVETMEAAQKEDRKQKKVEGKAKRRS